MGDAGRQLREAKAAKTPKDPAFLVVLYRLFLYERTYNVRTVYTSTMMRCLFEKGPPTNDSFEQQMDHNKK